MNVNLDALSDITKINISRVGYNSSEFMLERQLLMNDKSYYGSVSKFDVDLGNTHMLTTNPLNYNLFEIKRRAVGAAIAQTNISILRPGILAQGANRFNISPNVIGIINSPSEFMRLFVRFITTFDRLQREV